MGSTKIEIAGASRRIFEVQIECRSPTFALRASVGEPCYWF